ncbi:type I-C CRISPR-associated protein Cas8c/Csd1, partial [bacterium]|nr:type I-C CRISPR-associated protein Cas8c/Csd1 [bacterium]
KDNAFSDSYQKINEALLSESTSQLTGSCALTGKQEPLITETFPEITLKGVGQTRLFSMFKQIPAQFRYGRSGAEIFPVSEVEIRKIANALETICAPEQERRTWRTIPSTKPKKSDLLIAWLSGEKAIKQNEAVRDAMAQLCFSPSSSDAITQYEAHLRNFINLFAKPDSSFSFDDVQRILILTQVDKSRREIVANLTYQLDSVSKGISSWAQLAERHIYFKIPVKFTGERRVVSLAPYVPSPASVMDVFRKLYLQCGRVEATQGVAAKKVFDILLKPPFGQMALENELLQRLLMNVSELLINLRSDQIISSQLWQNGKRREAEKVLNPYSTTARIDALVSISFFEILLGRLEKGKRRYLMTAIYQVGKLLAKADELHLAYSHDVRKEDIPSQLIGNSLVRIAMQTPVQALERLGERIVVYQNWTKVHHERTKDSHIGMLLAQIGRIAGEIDLSELEQTVTPKTKAALLLGYLAWEKSKKLSDGGE